jgi:ribosomal protein L11 methyltransferase
MDYIELEVKVFPKQPATDLLISELAENGFESFSETPEGFFAYIPASAYTDELLGPVQKLDAEMGKAEFSSKLIPGRNWNEEWEKQFQPVEIGKKFRIRAPFHEPDRSFGIDLVIQPRQSFGTGHHPTTRLMAEKLLTMPLNGRYVLDMGCGTGVLSILASRLGAAEAVGIDIETNAVENARDNISHNPGVHVTVEEGTENRIAGRKFDVVLANINKNVLLEAIPAYADALRNNGDLLLSGFFLTDTKELTGKAESENLVHESTASEGDWAMLHFKKHV